MALTQDRVQWLALLEAELDFLVPLPQDYLSFV
jgi:hypothetical protein